MNIHSTPSGTLRDEQKACQPLDFVGLFTGDGCAPTDIDFSRDYRTRGGRLVLRADAKHGLTPLTEGQRIHFELDARVYACSGVPYYFAVVRHMVEAPAKIYAKDCRVDLVLEGEKWVETYRGKTLLEFEAILIARHGVRSRVS